jgi:hypothetical protein
MEEPKAMLASSDYMMKCDPLSTPDKAILPQSSHKSKNSLGQSGW